MKTDESDLILGPYMTKTMVVICMHVKEVKISTFNTRFSPIIKWVADPSVLYTYSLSRNDDSTRLSYHGGLIREEYSKKSVEDAYGVD